MSENLKEQIEEAKDELRMLLKAKIKRLRKKEAAKDAHGEPIKAVVRDALGRVVSKGYGDD